jgi:hypothetical protein
LELDEQLFDEYSEEIYKDKSIYTLHYPKDDKKVCVSFGYGIKNMMNIILNINEISDFVHREHQY